MKMSLYHMYLEVILIVIVILPCHLIVSVFPKELPDVNDTCHHLIVHMISAKKIALLIMLMTTNLDTEIRWVIQLRE